MLILQTLSGASGGGLRARLCNEDCYVSAGGETEIRLFSYHISSYQVAKGAIHALGLWEGGWSQSDVPCMH